MVDLTDQYLPAMQALNDFYAMLFDALLTSLPEATISTSGAYVWRSYRIDSYKTLAINQYYFQIDNNLPRTLVLKESFKYKGTYRNFTIDEVDLLKDGFFKRSCQEQQKYLYDFVTNATQAALAWQVLKIRQESVPPEYQQGKKIFRHKFKGQYTINQVPEDFIYAFPMQDKIFQLLIPGIKNACKTALSKEVNLIQNASWCNWDFRGFRMKFLNAKGEIPAGPSDYVWRIYYKEPAVLTCERYKGKDYPPIPPFILSPDFLSTSEQEQRDRLFQFALQSLTVK